MKYLYFLFVSVFSIITFNLSANNDIDSLKEELIKQPQSFAAEINLKIAESFYKKNIDSALKYGIIN